jgi:hypothetical protein
VNIATNAQAQVIEVRHNGVPFLRGHWASGSTTETGGIFVGVEIPSGEAIATGLAPASRAPGRTFHEVAAE